MSLDSEGSTPDGRSIVCGGPTHHVARRLGFEPPTPRRRLLKVVLLVLVTWVPLVLISLMHGRAWGLLGEIPLLLDPAIYSRYLFVIPVLELAQVLVDKSLAVQTSHFLDSGLVPPSEQPRFESAWAVAIRLRDSILAEVVLAVLALAIALVSRLAAGSATSHSSWERFETALTPAGWWNTLVSLPLLIFFLLRWVWIFLLWAWFLFRVSRLELELTPTHPDRAGGLGFLGWGLASFSIILLAVSAVLSGGFAGEILFRGSSLDRLKYHVMIFVALALVIVHAPLLAFSGRLARCRFQALLEFGTLISRHDRAFDEKWVKPPTVNQESLLGSPDVSSLADIAHVFEDVNRMQLIPFDRKALLVLIVAALIPMIPLVGTSIPFTEIFSKLAELMI
jgi:hypothetical protein